MNENIETTTGDNGKRTATERLGTALRPFVPTSLGKRLPLVSDATTDRENRHSQMSDEDVVYQLVDASGGRIKQATIANRTDWSESKVSRLLTRMEAEGVIARYRVGREKVVRFPDRNS